MKLKNMAVLFDMDGVLVDVSDSYRQTIKRTAELYVDCKISNETIQYYKDRGNLNNDWDLTHSILHDYGVSITLKEVKSVFQEIYLGTAFNGLIKNERCLIDLESLGQLTRLYPCGIVTGRPRLEAEYALDRFGLQRFFQTVITMDDLPRDKGKPHPMGLFMALERLNCSGGWYIGDTIDDMRAAHKAGLIAIIVPYKKTIVDPTTLFIWRE